MFRGIILRVSRAFTKKNAPYARITVAFFKEANVHENRDIYVWSAPESMKLSPGTFFEADETRLQKFKDDENYSIPYDACKNEESPEWDKALIEALRSIYPKPIKEELWVSLIDNLSKRFKNEKLKEFFINRGKEFYSPYSIWTAATTIHHAYKGGLLNHTYEMLNMFYSMLDTLPFEYDIDIVAIALLYHDRGKLFEYEAREDGSYVKNEIMPLLGHVFLSAHMLYNDLMHSLGEKKYLENKNILLIVHAVLAHHSKLEWGSPVLPATVEAFIVSRIDEISGHGYGYNVASNLETNKMDGITYIKWRECSE